MKYNFIFLIMSICLLSFVSSADYRPHQINTDLNFTFTDDQAIQCNITTMEYPDGSFVWINQVMSKTGDTYTGSILAGNFTGLGTYCIWMDCVDGTGDICREVTNNGENPTGAKIGLSVVLILMLSIFFIITSIGCVKSDGYKSKFVLYWVSHLLMIAITFISWQTAVNYLSMGAGVAGIFKILFYISMISAFPMIILSLTWIFYIHTFNEHFQKLVDKGVSPEDAFSMTTKKKGGWINGN